MAPKRKGVGKQNFEWIKNKIIQGLGNKKLLSFSKHDSLKYWRLKGNVNCRMPVKFWNHLESLFWSFSYLSGGKWCLQRKYMCRQHETLDCTKLNKHLLNSYHRSGKEYRSIYVWQFELYPFVKFLARSGYLFFDWYLKLAKKYSTFYWFSKLFNKKSIFLRVPPPPP